VVEAADLGDGHDVAALGRLDGSGERRVAGERHVGAVVVVVGDELAHGAEQVTLAHDDQMIEQLTP
jgi:hypothetical protein